MPRANPQVRESKPPVKSTRNTTKNTIRKPTGKDPSAKKRTPKKKAEPSVDAAHVLKVLKARFGLRKLRPGQEEVIRSILEKKDTLAIMPTGAGKSLCYQLPALIMPGTTVVVSPLISLMKDQADKLEDLDIDVAEINSAQSQSDLADDIKRMEAGKAEIVHVTPERLTNPEFLEKLKQNKIDFFVVDEAHCITEWGHDFRPAYLRLKDAIQALGHPHVLALTATATEETAKDIKERLGIETLNVVHTGVLRDNLYYEVIQTADAEDQKAKLVEYLKTVEGPGIVYAATVKGVDELHSRLSQELDQPISKYHGRLSAKERIRNQDEFMSSQTKIMIATNAFGMGIDKRDIRFVAHMNFPSSLEAYYQESGRAGRDGKRSRCTLFYLKEDKRTQSFFLSGKHPRSDEIREVYRHIAKTADEKGRLKTSVLEEKLEGVAKKRVHVIASALLDEGVLERSGRANFKLLSSKEPETVFMEIEEEFQRRIDADKERLKQIIVYAQSAMCRWKIILSYFDQKAEWHNCGHCDSCERPVLSESGELLGGVKA